MRIGIVVIFRESCRNFEDLPMNQAVVSEAIQIKNGKCSVVACVRHVYRSGLRI